MEFLVVWLVLGLSAQTPETEIRMGLARPDFIRLDPAQEPRERSLPTESGFLAIGSPGTVVITPSEGFTVDPYYQDANNPVVADPGFCWVFVVPWEPVAQRCSDLDGCVIRLAAVASLRDSAKPLSFQLSGNGFFWYLGGIAGSFAQQGVDQDVVGTPAGACFLSDDTFGISDGSSGSDIRDFTLWDCTDFAFVGLPDNYTDSSCRLTIED